MAHSEIPIGERIVAARREVGMTQRELADASGLSQLTVRRVEEGSEEPSPLQLSALAFGCGLSQDALHGSNAARQSAMIAGRADDEGAADLENYLLFALDLARKLDETGIPDHPKHAG